MFAASALLEKLLDGRAATVVDAGELLLDQLSNGSLNAGDFLSDPPSLLAPPHSIPRYLAQVTLRAIQNDYDGLEVVVSALQSLADRNPPVLESGRGPSEDRVVIPEARVVDLRYPTKKDDGHWESGIVVHVTSGRLRGREIDLHLLSDESREACLLVPMLWLHCSVAIYNIQPAGDGWFVGCKGTFLVIEPARQINATAISRSLHCTKPQLDQIRRGRGDTTLLTLKGMIIHAVFDRLLAGDTGLFQVYSEILPRFQVQIAAVADESFDEDSFRADVLRHAESLSQFIAEHPHLQNCVQMEVRRNSATLGIQGRIDAVFQQGNRLDILELKTGARLRDEDHAQLFIYRLLMSDFVRRRQRETGQSVEVSGRLLSSADGRAIPLLMKTNFHQVLDARNKLVATHYALGHESPHFRHRFEGFQEGVCSTCATWTRKQCRNLSDLFGDRPNAEETPALAYFRKFTRLVERERWAAEQDLAELLDDSRIDSRKSNFRTMEVRIVENSEPYTFEFDSDVSDLQAGDAVLLHCGNISSTPVYHGRILDIQPRRMRLSIPLNNLDVRVFQGLWIVDRLPSDVTAEASHTALYDFLISRQGWSPMAMPLDPMSDHNLPFVGLNASQIEAITRASHCVDFHLIWGPPGTGKTRVIPEIIRRVDGPVLLGAFTNTAVDKMLTTLLDHDPGKKFLRIGRAQDSPGLAKRLKDPAEYFSDDLAVRLGSTHAVRRAMDQAPIVGATAHRACTMPYLRQRRFEMTIVDEAGQLTEPLTLGVTLRSRRFILVGDDRQLPPVVRTKDLAQSMFERLKQNEENSSSHRLTLLDTQYRMHPQIMAVANRFFYNGRLNAGVSALERMPPDGHPVQFVPVSGAITEARSNFAEASAVSEIVTRYLEMPGIVPESIGVITPFRAQAATIRKLIAAPGVTVDTVERFQGGERDIMILSLVRAQSSEFVFDERRFNVAITRARRKLIVVAHPELFRNSNYEWLSAAGAVYEDPVGAAYDGVNELQEGESPLLS